MKKLYSKPSLEVEVYQLSASIAANCGNVVSLGPWAPGHETCSEYEGGFDVMGITVDSNGTSFYADGSANCDCYYTASGTGLFTS